MIDRREALRRLGVSAVSLALPSTLLELSGCAGTRGGRAFTGPVITPFDRISPVDRNRASARAFAGDAHPEHFHALLWNKAEALKRPLDGAPEEARVVVVGGGVSGLMTAYLLRDLKPVLLDKSERFGGNSRGESWENVDYTIGAAYLGNQEPGSKLYDLYREAGIFGLCRKRKESDPVLLKGRVYTDFWGGQTDPAAAKQFTRLRDYFLSCLAGSSPMPNMPAESDADLPLIAATDRHDFLSFLVRKLGEPLHPHVHTLLELYCWATLGASMQEVSAAVALNYYVAEFGEILVAPAGNAAIAERFLRLFVDAVGLRNARTDATVIDVREEKGSELVTYADGKGNLRQIRAAAVVMACPKFIASRLLGDFGKDRAEAMKRMGYRAYVLGNALLDRPPQRDFHDVYLLKDGEIPFGDTQRNVHNHGVCDATFANYGQLQKDHTVITLCHPLPYDGGRSDLLLPDAFERYHKLMTAELFEKILPPLGYYNTDLKELRLTRWGHPIPYAKPGFFFANGPAILSKPFRGRVFFVNQDTWAAPAIETCALEALKWAPKVREVI
ncbi:hypothetical protein FACS189492_1360 [Clostridia bacterium]|jgi:hypothetical protein|nr:hypothetical protein FACS189492_1360 [Clostridia bacterium]